MSTVFEIKLECSGEVTHADQAEEPVTEEQA